MQSENLKFFLFKTFIVFILFAVDRITKIYIIKLTEFENVVDLYLTSFLNIYLIWNKGIAFGLFAFNQNSIYNLISLIIFLIIFILLIMILKTTGLRQYSLIFVLGGSLGNLFDRIYYSAVPDFIDFHINNFHWFIFNVADIFITIGIACLIFVEIKNEKKNEKLT